MTHRARVWLAVVVTAVLVAGLLVGGHAWWERRQERHAFEQISQALLVGCLERAETAPDVTAATNQCLDEFAARSVRWGR